MFEFLCKIVRSHLLKTDNSRNGRPNYNANSWPLIYIQDGRMIGLKFRDHSGRRPLPTEATGGLRGMSNSGRLTADMMMIKEREGLQPASKYAVALGKIYRQWEETMDTGVHKSDVSEIKIPVRYLGEAGHYQEDIALVFMSTAVVYRTYIRPVCIDFSPDFDKNQLQNSNLGRISGWGLTSADGSAAKVLRTAELPYVDLVKCIAEVPYAFRPYITSDKFCAGIKNGTGVCRGDSGGGLAFPSVERGVQRYYLRGVVAPAPYDLVHKCNVDTFTILTHVQHHATFIKEHVLV